MYVHRAVAVGLKWEELGGEEGESKRGEKFAKIYIHIGGRKKREDEIVSGRVVGVTQYGGLYAHFNVSGSKWGEIYNVVVEMNERVSFPPLGV